MYRVHSLNTNVIPREKDTENRDIETFQKAWNEQSERARDGKRKAPLYLSGVLPGIYGEANRRGAGFRSRSS
jgi:hypothetical protein